MIQKENITRFKEILLVLLFLFSLFFFTGKPVSKPLEKSKSAITNVFTKYSAILVPENENISVTVHQFKDPFTGFVTYKHHSIQEDAYQCNSLPDNKCAFVKRKACRALYYLIFSETKEDFPAIS